ncbi:hypothetical protein [Mesorhizobium sp. SP-1A]|uniref:hypothetical protein n=1 Tax=Mesorhizobium sp. SP-1A TaxID=3077840 RepID=UPI0028F7027F|nr:hypothetical protein [Mesorhizobium sp. SP-1A]
MKTSEQKSGTPPGFGVCVIDVSVEEIPAHMLRVSQILEMNRNDSKLAVKWRMEGRSNRHPAMSRVEGPVAGIAAFLNHVYVSDEDAKGTPTVFVR